MRVTKRSLRGREGEIAVTAETLDDLWHLKYIVEKGDLVFALTKRKADAASDKLRPEKVEKVKVRLGIRVEEMEFHKFANRLRIHGPIEHGMDAGSYHTLNVEIGTNISIFKEHWKNDQLQRIQDAEEAGKRPKVVIVAVEEGDADIGFVRHYGIEVYSHIRQSSGKRENGLRSDFFREIVDQLRHAVPEDASIVIAGPGFTKEDFLKYFHEIEPEMASKALTEDTSMIGMSGFQEVLRRGAVDRIMQESRIARESSLMEDLLREISMDGKAAYGFADVKNALNYGAVETLLIADETLREGREKGEDIDKVLMKVEQAQGKVVVFSTAFEPGEKLHKLGGVAALLRFKVTG
ncbi:putative cell division protein [Methanosarcina siciliae T4/M]|uniref:Protein pelota homolog n=2 Tax=Methanosarcina siciliae TaxID=38027 RepID=A0A0E3PAZ2_9EURY|nr:mRNA surveillance protein pelota [Methanosarcina siciliae]AKB27290.1 putative cell division protein [Methanosarcina siciliae T4/M]AKB31229.1 putative cell division protein [Methanosarcina siciliae HI350]